MEGPFGKELDNVRVPLIVTEPSRRLSGKVLELVAETWSD
jgi:hypothetical protein